MSKWIQFYEKAHPFDYKTKSFLPDKEIDVPMCGSDSIMRIDGRWGIWTVRCAVQKYIGSMKYLWAHRKISGFTILEGSSLLDGHESKLYRI